MRSSESEPESWYHTDIHKVDKPTPIYIDGSFLRNGGINSKFGFGVYWGKNDPRNRNGTILADEPSNSIAELFALSVALNQILHYRDSQYIIFSDSESTTLSATDWGDKWEAHGWYKTNHHRVRNQALIRKIRAKIKLAERLGIYIDIRYVPGHAGVYGNEMADTLAKQATGYIHS